MMSGRGGMRLRGRVWGGCCCGKGGGKALAGWAVVWMCEELVGCWRGGGLLRSGIGKSW